MTRVNLWVVLSALLLMACAGDAPIVITDAEPGFVLQGATKAEVRIRGEGFAEGARVEFLVTGSGEPADITVDGVRLIDPQTIVVIVSASSQAQPAVLDIRVTANDRTGRGTELFGIVKAEP